MIEYKPREPRNKIIFPNAARTLLGIQQVGLDNLGILLDFGHSLYGLETPADAAQLCIDHGKLFAIDVNDNFRGWDDDMVVGSVHLVETFEFFHTLRRNNWDGVWQLDQFPFREDSVAAAKAAIRFLKALHGALDSLDEDALAAAQAAHDALGRPAADPAGAADLDDRTGRGMTALSAEHTTMPVRRPAPGDRHPERAGRAHRRGGPADPDPGRQAGPLRRRRPHRRGLLRHRRPGHAVRRGAERHPGDRRRPGA